jgi:hypothetical protein
MNEVVVETEHESRCVVSFEPRRFMRANRAVMLAASSLGHPLSSVGTKRRWAAVGCGFLRKIKFPAEPGECDRGGFRYRNFGPLFWATESIGENETVLRDCLTCQRCAIPGLPG